MDSKILTLILIGIVLYLVYRYADKSSKKTESKNIDLDTQYYFKYDNLNNQNEADLIPILKTNKVKHNKRVRFNLPDKLNTQEKDLIQQNINNHLLEIKNNDDNTNQLCLKKDIDLNHSFSEKLNDIKNCKKIQNNVSLRDIYDDIVIDYKKINKQEQKDLIPVINSRKDAAFNLSSYDNTHWNYQDENSINGGIIENNLYANDPMLDQIAKF
jgi:hypothetical protein